jgi:hypothetical protein
VQPRHLLDQIDFADEIGTPAGYLYRDAAILGL